MEHAMKKMIKRLVQQNKLPMFLFNFFSKLNLIFIKIFIRELKEEVKSYGNLNPDDTIYIIRIKPPGEGFYSNVFHVLSKIKFAISRGFIPVVDMLNYSTIFHDKGFRGNLWERYYSQPCNLNLEDAY